MAKKKRRSNPWTTGEIRLLRDLHTTRVPSSEELVKHFPRHTRLGALSRARELGLRRIGIERQQMEEAQNYLAAAREYLAGRGHAVLAYLGTAIPEAAE